ncbi:DNA-binding response regulator, NarL/FixJ family, contains REC and HTH domains [Dyadobacter sp. SG02]|uniref:response regulator n=1 Tax=Dyadobacter sp. SG02 TaxID=1855291 RepID=UPI0008C211D0|nr:response regulator transcription factor [Dyadobacter sp. SG02]SEJ50524.1 DNA-binding response regulator, NarL/FixJ family, contains REC and HTH domains [Dyadobacter sp. SG02]
MEFRLVFCLFVLSLRTTVPLHSAPTRVLLVEDHDIVRIATGILVQETIGHATIDTASNFKEAVQAVSSNTYRLIILDLSIPGTDYLLTIEKLRSLQPAALILVFSGQKEELYGVHCMRAGAAGFVSKESKATDLQEAIRVVLKGQKYLSPVVREQLLNSMTQQAASDPAELLSAKELVVMEMLLAGKWTKDIAGQLNLKSTTVSTFKARIFKKLGVNNLLDLAKRVELYHLSK